MHNHKLLFDIKKEKEDRVKNKVCVGGGVRVGGERSKGLKIVLKQC